MARVAGSGRASGAAEAALMKALYDEHAAVLWRYALRLTGDASQSEDVVQETLLRAWQHPEVVGDTERSARAWLFTVARNMIIDDRRSARFRNVVASTDEAGAPATQSVYRGPAASQIAIKQIGTNGGGYFNSNSSVPFENPTPGTNFVEMLLILLIPAALTYTFGLMVGSRAQGWSLFAAMMVVLVVAIFVAVPFEQRGGEVLQQTGVELSATADSTLTRSTICASICL